MTTIHEMDEFFNFEDAAHPGSFPPNYRYDTNLAFAEAENDEDSFTALQHFDSSPEQALSLELHNIFSHNDNEVQDTAMMGAADFMDFPRWIEGMDVPRSPCEYCGSMGLHCKVLKEGIRKGSCTSCVALNRSCSLNFRGGNRNLTFHGGLEVLDWDGDGKVDGRSTRQQECELLDKCELPENVAHQNKDDGGLERGMSASDLAALKESADNGPKVGARFSREALRVLRGWLSTHHRHPYPTDEEKESLTRQTGLNKVQITNWLANARRRGKVRAPRSTSPAPQHFANGMDIPRRSTPALQEMNPLERWKHSPPDHEAASITAIAKAVSSSTFSSGLDSPLTRYSHTDDGSARSTCNVSSASSLGTSHGTSHSSGGSFASAFSHKSRGSFGSFNSLSINTRGRRRRRRQAPKPAQNITQMTTPPRTFQCTFCTETFKTKHDWQRHEKSLHLSLERWVCSPNGATQFSTENNSISCVYCGIPNPSPSHSETHNHSSCAERSLSERTFYRKDHLRQHLNLVHDVKFQAGFMDAWKVATPEIRSRCGFCGTVMDSWSARVDHLAEHFKGGKSMKDWRGDWGFEASVLEVVENGMPPYLIHDERNTPRPFEASEFHANTEKTMEDHIKVGLVDYINDSLLQGGPPTDDDLLVEAKKIFRRVQAMEDGHGGLQSCWFHDLIMLSGDDSALESPNPLEIEPQATLEKTPWADNMERFSQQTGTICCVKQRALFKYVVSQQMLGLTPTDKELQTQACKILDDLETTSNYKCKGAVQWFKYLIFASTTWLAGFRRKAGLPRSSEMAVEHIRSSDEKTIDYSIHNSYRLEHELVEFVKWQRVQDIIPTDADLQRQARIIIYGTDDPWNQTAIDDPAILHLFKRQNDLSPSSENDLHPVAEEPSPSSAPSPRTLHWDLENTGAGLPSPVTISDRRNQTHIPLPKQDQPSAKTDSSQPLRYFLNDANCYGRLVRELTRFVTSCLSPNNPNQHVPSDAELQNQARWVIYDDDDPWNQTAADNAEWLVRFKRDVGLADPTDDGPGLPLFETPRPWTVKDGGTGFAPPYVRPQPKKVPEFKEDVPVTVDAKTYTISKETAGKFVQDLESGRYAAPASVFCSRDLENGLGEYVRLALREGVVPSDEQLRDKARCILGVERTAADDGELLEKFKALHALSSGTSGQSGPRDLNAGEDRWAPGGRQAASMENNGMSGSGPGPVESFNLPNFSAEVNMLDINNFDLELGTLDLGPFATGVVDPSLFVTAEGEGGMGPLYAAGGAFSSDLNLNKQAGEMEMLDQTSLSLNVPIPDPVMGAGDEFGDLDLGSMKGFEQDDLAGRDCLGQFGGLNGLAELEVEKRDGIAELGGLISSGRLGDYSDLHRVHAATASPLRRRASKRLARGVPGVGFNMGG